MKKTEECNGKYWFTCTRCLRLLVKDLRDIVRPSKDTDWNIMNDKEKIAQEKEKITRSLRILDEILDIIRFKDEPEDTIIDQKLEEIKKILTT